MVDESLPPDVGRLFAMAGVPPEVSADTAPAIDGYRLQGLLGKGGMARVFQAADRSGREVAIKVLRNHTNSQRFLREGQIVAGLKHPRILAVHAVGQGEGFAYLVYPLIRGGQTLRTRCRAASLEQKLGWIAEVADALAYAHAAGVVHRDVKPENVLFDPSGRLYLADFGIALSATLSRLTQTGALVGTPAYMAPEQLHGQKLEQSDPVDVWALGVMLYEALAGELPFPGPNLVMFFGQVQAGAPRIRNAPRSLERLCRGALAPLGTERPTAAGVRDALRAYLDGASVGAGSWKPWLAVAGGAVLPLVGVATWLGVTSPKSTTALVPEAAPIHSRSVAEAGPIASRGALAAFARAGVAYENGDFEEAEAEFRASLSRLDPQRRSTALTRLAAIYRERIEVDYLRSGSIPLAAVELLASLPEGLPPKAAARRAAFLLDLASRTTRAKPAARAQLFGLARRVGDPRQVDVAWASYDLSRERYTEARERLPPLRAQSAAEEFALHGELHVRAGALNQAEGSIATALARQPGLARAWYAWALLLEARGDSLAALRAVEQAEALRPGRSWVQPVRSRLLLRSGDLTGALAASEAAILQSGSKAAWAAHAQAQAANGLFSAAAHSWKRVTERDPSLIKPWAGRIAAERLSGEEALARSTLNEALAQFPDAPTLRLEEFWLLEASGEANAARALLLKLANRRPPFLAALRIVAQRAISWSVGWSSPRTALQAARAILAESPHDFEAWLICATAHWRLNEFEPGREAAQRACDLDPQSGPAASKLGQALMALGREAEGLRALNRAVELEPDDIFLLYNRAEGYRSVGDHAAAANDLQAFSRRDSGNFHVHWTLADSLSLSGDPEGAEARFASALELVGGDDPWFVYYHRGLSRERHGDPSGARTDHRQAIESTRDAGRRAQCRAALKRLEGR